MSRLSFSAKFVTISVAILLLVSGLLLATFQQFQSNRSAAHSELRGVSVLRPLLKALSLSQQHRGTASAALGGDATMRAAMSDKTRETDVAMSAVSEALAAAGFGSELDKRWGQVVADWSSLRDTGMQMAQTPNFTAHTALIQNLQSFISELTETSKLILDPEAETYFSIVLASEHVPRLTERLGRIRGMGSGFLASKSMTELQVAQFTGFLGGMEAKLADFDEGLKHALRNSTRNQGVLQEAQKGLEGEIRELKSVAERQIVQQSFAMEPKEYFDLASRPIKRLNELNDKTILADIESTLQSRARWYDAKFVLLSVLTVAVGLLCLFLFVGFYMALSSALRALVSSTQKVAAGNLAERVQIDSRDEFALVGQEFNLMVEAFGRTVIEVQGNANRVTEAAEHLASAATHVAAGSEKQSEAASRMAAAVEELTVSIGEVSQYAVNAEGYATKSRDLSVSGFDTVNRSVSDIGSVAELVTQSAERIRELGEESQRIGQMVDVIKEIADQTNLLALNAAIEAARAGETGRGFAVVADEVRKLAERAARATEEIGGVIGSIQQSTERAVAAMEGGVRKVHESVETTTQAGKVMQRIREDSDSVREVVAGISAALREQGTVSTEVARNVEQVATMADDNHTAIADTTRTAADLRELSRKMLTTVRRFKV
ncbi:MAG: methyl-accepting chemotaxis protein [Rhodocyclaceae bacterium]